MRINTIGVVSAGSICCGDGPESGLRRRIMYGQVTSGRPPLAEPIDVVLGHRLSPSAQRFAAEHADFLVRVDFRDIADHSDPYIRSAEAHCSCDGVRHTIWLDTKSADFEGLMLHQAMRGILMERGFPRTKCPPCAALFPFLLYLSSLLGSAITDPVIDRWLTQEDLRVYDRELLVRRTTAQVWLDARRGPPKEYGLLFCKWALLTVLMRLDPTFERETTNLLYALIRKKFPEPWGLGDELSQSIRQKGFTEPHSALYAMLELRSALRLEDKIEIIDAEGIRLR